MPYLLKSEPDAYSFSDLLREKETVWDGVTNPVALRNLRDMKAGEKLVIYHTGNEKKAVGTATVTSVDAADPKNPVVRIRAAQAIPQPKSLADIKASSLFRESPLVRQGRLSVVPLDARQYAWLVGE
ncbi:MAG: EVE domain-containing protein [Bryobacteraceae bacterium]